MPEMPSDATVALSRQRRFLMLMSLAVIAHYFFGAEVKREANLSGFLVSIEHPERVVVGVWIVWSWAFLRYLQRAYERLSVLWYEIIEDVNAEDRRIVVAKAKKHGNKLAASGNTFKELKTSARIQGTVTINPIGDVALSSDYFEFNGGRKYSGLAATFVWDDEEPGSRSDKFEMYLTRYQVYWLRTRAWIYAIIWLPAVSEHIAPVLLAIIAVLAGFFCNCI